MFLAYRHKIHLPCILPFWYICVAHKNMSNLPNTWDYFPYIVLLIGHNIDLIDTRMCMRYIWLVVSRKIGHSCMLTLFSNIYFVFMSKFRHVYMCLWCWYMCFYQEHKFVSVGKYFSNLKFSYWIEHPMRIFGTCRWWNCNKVFISDIWYIVRYLSSSHVVLWGIANIFCCLG